MAFLTPVTLPAGNRDEESLLGCLDLLPAGWQLPDIVSPKS